MTIYDLLRQLILLYLWGIAALSDSPKHFVYAAISGLLAFSLTWITSRLIYRNSSRRFIGILRGSRLDSLIDLCFVVFSLYCVYWQHMRLDGLL